MLFFIGLLSDLNTHLSISQLKFSQTWASNLQLLPVKTPNLTFVGEAEQYHQQYLASAGSRQYCSASPTKVKLGDFIGSNYKLEDHIWENFNWEVDKCVLRSDNNPIKNNI